MVENEKKKDEVVINLDTLGVPIAIVIAGVIIASVLYFTSKNQNVDTTDNSGTKGTVTDDNDSSTGDVVAYLGDDPYLGNKDTAKVAIIDFSDYQCGYCQRHAEETFPDLKTNFIDTGKIVYVFKEFPLSAEGQIGYTTAHAAACVFDLAGSEVYANFHKGAFFLTSESAIKKLATGLGVDSGKYDSCMAEKKFVDEMAADRTEGSNAGVTGTPGFVIGVIGEDGKVTGKLIAGAYPYETFEDTIKGMLGE